MGRKNIDRIERGVKKTDKHEEVQMSTLASDHIDKLNLFSYIFRTLFQNCQWKIYFRSVLSTH